MTPRASAVVAALSLGAAALVGAACGRVQSRDESKTGRPAVVGQLASFRYAVERIRATHPTGEALDWDQLTSGLESRAALSKSNEELRTVLRILFSRLGESHFSVVGTPPEEVETEPSGPRPPRRRASDACREASLPFDGTAWRGHGVDVRWWDGDAIVVRAEGPAKAVGLQPGLTLLEVDGLDVRSMATASLGGSALEREGPILARAAVLDALGGPAGERRCVRFQRTQAGTVRGHWLTLAEPERVPAQIEVPAKDVVLVRLESFDLTVAPAFRTAVRDALKGLIIDLRGNPGGVATMVTGLGGHLLGPSTPSRSFGQLKFRETTLELRVLPKPDGERFDGELAILIDETTASTAEIFAAGLKTFGRGRLFGRPTSGLALPSQQEKLPNGDTIQFVVAHYQGPNNEAIEGRGVAPHVRLPRDREALLDGRDPALEAALRWVLR